MPTTSAKYILAISTSPRVHGNTDLLVDEVIRGINDANQAAPDEDPKFEVEKLHLWGRNISLCRHCDFCLSKGICSIQDDMQEIYPKLIKADGLIFASPIYFMAVNAQAKMLIDRCQMFWARRYVLKQSLFDTPRGPRRAIFVATGGTRGKNIFDGAKLMMKWFLDSLEMEYYDNLLFNTIDQKGAIKNHPTALNQAYQLGQKIAREW